MLPICTIQLLLYRICEAKSSLFILACIFNSLNVISVQNSCPSNDLCKMSVLMHVSANEYIQKYQRETITNLTVFLPVPRIEALVGCSSLELSSLSELFLRLLCDDRLGARFDFREAPRCLQHYQYTWRTLLTVSHSSRDFHCGTPWPCAKARPVGHNENPVYVDP